MKMERRPSLVALGPPCSQPSSPACLVEKGEERASGRDAARAEAQTCSNAWYLQRASCTVWLELECAWVSRMVRPGGPYL